MSPLRGGVLSSGTLKRDPKLENYPCTVQDYEVSDKERRRERERERVGWCKGWHRPQREYRIRDLRRFKRELRGLCNVCGGLTWVLSPQHNFGGVGSLKKH